jgi:hypothetical protein
MIRAEEAIKPIAEAIGNVIRTPFLGNDDEPENQADDEMTQACAQGDHELCQNEYGGRIRPSDGGNRPCHCECHSG